MGGIMTAPMDPNELEDGPTEFSYGPGMFAPGTASNEGQSREQGNFGQYAYPPIDSMEGDDANFARAVADRRTDPCDPNSGRSFETLGNPDRYGAQPPLIRADPESIKSQRRDNPVGLPPLKRKW